jgi:hypothetical protein
MDSPELSSAEWVAEAPSACTNDGRCHELPLANFGSVTFSKIATIANAHPGTITDTAWQSALIRLVPDAQLGQVVSSTAGATPAAASADGRSFTVNWTGAAA